MEKRKLVIVLLVIAAIFALASIFLHFYAQDLFSSNGYFNLGGSGGNIALTVENPPSNVTGGAG